MPYKKTIRHNATWAVMPIVGLIKKYRNKILKNLKCFLFLKGKLPFLSHSKEQQKPSCKAVPHIKILLKLINSMNDTEQDIFCLSHYQLYQHRLIVVHTKKARPQKRAWLIKLRGKIINR